MSHHVIAGRLTLALIFSAGALAASDIASPPERKAAPAFALQDASGRTTKLADFAGKVTLIDFMATWCYPCERDVPCLSEAAARFKDDGFAVVGIALDTEDNRKQVASFVERTKPAYRILLTDEATTAAFKVEAVPLKVPIDRKGRIAATFPGAAEPEVFEAAVRALLAER